MSRNNVRGPTSALTEYLKTQGITANTIARRVRTQTQNQNQNEQPVAGPSNSGNASRGSRRASRATRASGYVSDDLDDAGENPEDSAQVEEESPSRGRRPTRGRKSKASGYASDNLDADEAEEDAMDVDEEEEQFSPAKKRKLTKAAEAKLKAQEKKKLGKKGSDDEDEEDSYNALSRSLRSNKGGASPSKPPVGSFENCSACEKQFTVTKYTMASNSGTGFLCHPCAKASGGDPFKKPASPRKRKAPADKRQVTSFEVRRFPSLVSICITLITKHINDIESLGDIGSLNLEAISKALSKNRGLTTENAHLFYSATNTSLVLYDATNLPPPALDTLAQLNPNLTSLRLDFCGRLDDDAFKSFSTGLPNLKRLELLGPFLVRPPGWQAFFKSHPNLQAFLMTQSPRFDFSCLNALVRNCKSLTELRLKEVGKLDDAFCEEISLACKASLTHLDLSDPSASCSEDAVVGLLKKIGKTLKHLDLSNHDLLTDSFLTKGLKAHTKNLEFLYLNHLPELTTEGVAAFFSSWSAQSLLHLSLARNHELGSDALVAILRHSGSHLEELNLNGWKEVGEPALSLIGQEAKELKKLDVGWCREMDDFIMKAWLEVDGLKKLEEVKVWGCNKITDKCPKRAGVSIFGIESHVQK